MSELLFLIGIDILVSVVGVVFLYLVVSRTLKEAFAALRFQIRSGEWKDPEK